MKTFRTNSGPFSERPHFEPGEIDRICNDELRKLALLPVSPEPIRIDRFIEKRFKIQPKYEHLPNGVLGFTQFGKNGVVDIVVSRSLAEEGTQTSDRRVRTTLAHEGGHGLLHAYLFGLQAPQNSLFGVDGAKQNQILCRDEATDDERRKSSWHEFQANAAIAGLLLPRRLVQQALEPYVLSTGAMGALTIDPARWQSAVECIAETFEVNPIVAKYRLESMDLPKGGRQLLL